MFEDNYEKTRRAIARFILEHAPKGIRPRERENLQTLAEGSEDARLYGIEFRLPSRREITAGQAEDGWGQLQCTLYADLDAKWGERFKDDDGNMWSVWKLSVAVNWPSFGSTDPTLAGERVDLMKAVCDFGKLLELEFTGPIYSLYASRQQLEEQAETNRIRTRTATVRDAVVQGATNMRVGQRRVANLTSEVSATWDGHSEVIDWGRPNGDVWKFSAHVHKVTNADYPPEVKAIVVFSRTA